MLRNIIITGMLCLALTAGAQDTARQEILDFQNELNKEYADSTKSPLSKAELRQFKGHHFFDIDLAYRVTATFKRTADAKPFKMATTRGLPRTYVKYGEATFTLGAKTYTLCLYQNPDLAKTEQYKDYLILPFRDLTNQSETYGGGRYIDMKIPTGNSIVIDFNKAYNPFCAYSDLYSCPIPPQENTLDTEIKAGTKKPETH
ncbi:MAG: DUF1684 domain-containing protein [Bacteroidetes bacterium]|nr:DUF1684 domain-containing protein [Bacteroidota bacterium]